MKRATFYLSLLILAACQSGNKHPQPGLLRTGSWHATLNAPGVTIPFDVRVEQADSAFVFHILNAAEDIPAEQVIVDSDSVHIILPVFDSRWNLARVNDSLLSGTWLKYSRYKPYTMDIRLEAGEKPRFPVSDPEPRVDFSGDWRTVFSPDNIEDTYMALGRFSQEDSHITGTFLTTTGDYRFLEGTVQGDSLFLSCFDGSHAFLFKARLQNDTIYGRFWSGKHWEEPWIAWKEPGYRLPDPDSLTFLKPGYDHIDFTLPDLDSNLVSLHDEAFRDKVIVLQIMGTWCPNCMDETAFMSEYYNAHPSDDLVFIGLAFERTNTFSQAVDNVRRLIQRFDIRYPILLAGFPSRDRINEVLPMIDHFMSYPTSIFIDREGRVRRIHTGFAGPATGNDFEIFKKEFDELIREMLGTS